MDVRLHQCHWLKMPAGSTEVCQQFLIPENGAFALVTLQSIICHLKKVYKPLIEYKPVNPWFPVEIFQLLHWFSSSSKSYGPRSKPSMESMVVFVIPWESTRIHLIYKTLKNRSQGDFPQPRNEVAPSPSFHHSTQELVLLGGKKGQLVYHYHVPIGCFNGWTHFFHQPSSGTMYRKPLL